MTDHLWFPELRSALASSSHLFLHYCAFHRVDERAEAILDELAEIGYRPELIDLRRSRPFNASPDTDLVILLHMELLRDTPRALQHLRVTVNAWAERSGGKVLIVSRSPRSAYPIGDGSSLVLDSRDLHLHESMLADWVIDDYQARADFSLPPAASRSRGLASELSRAEGLVDRQRFAHVTAQIACQTIYELGSTYIAWLEEMVLEYSLLSVPVVDVPEWMQAELMICGIARLDLDHRNLVLFTESLGSDGWIRGLRSASRLCTTAPTDWRETASTLFEIERIIRRRLAEAFEAKLGKRWPLQVLDRGTAAYIRDASGLRNNVALEFLANPLDFLTLGQLLGLLDQRSEAKHAGFDHRLILELKRLIPIRNRVQHMRLPKDGDFRTCRAVRRIMRLVLDE